MREWELSCIPSRDWNRGRHWEVARQTYLPEVLRTLVYGICHLHNHRQDKKRQGKMSPPPFFFDLDLPQPDRLTSDQDPDTLIPARIPKYHNNTNADPPIDGSRPPQMGLRKTKKSPGMTFLPGDYYQIPIPDEQPMLVSQVYVS